MISTIKIGSKQYSVSLGERFRVEKQDEKKGSLWTGAQVLALLSKEGELIVGKPFLETARVKARVLSHGKAKKVLILKKKRRKGYRRTQGHRQMYTELLIEALSDEKGQWYEWSPQKPRAKKAGAKKPQAKKAAAEKTKTVKKSNMKTSGKKA